MCLEAALRKENEENTMLPSSKSFMPRLYEPDSGSNFRYPGSPDFEAKSQCGSFVQTCMSSYFREGKLPILEVKTAHYV